MYIWLPWVFGIAFLGMSFAVGNASPLPFSVISFLIGFILIKYRKKQDKKNKENEEKERQNILLMQKKQAETEETFAYTEGLKKYSLHVDDMLRKMRNASDDMMSLGMAVSSSVYQEKEMDWAIHGGIANGIAGPIAGVSTAVNVMQENANIRERNKERRAWANNQMKSYISMAGESKKAQHTLIKEERDFIKEHRASFKKTPDELFSFIEITDEKTILDEYTGAITVCVNWKVLNKSTWIDGALRAKLYSNEKEFVGYAYLVFPKEGTSNGSGVLSGICPCPIPTENYNIVVEPVNLWEIVFSFRKTPVEEPVCEERKNVIKKYERRFKKEKYNYLKYFEKLNGHEDTAYEIDEEKYDQAVNLMNKGDFQEAIAIFEEIGDYKDSEEKLVQCDTAIIDDKYNNAVALVDTGNIIEAYNVFKSLGDYKNSKEILSSIHFEYEAEKRKEANIGDYIFFGTYEQDNDESNGKKAIEWRVLDKQDDRILVISKYGLCYEKYNRTLDKITWETCTLRKWLNNDFINTAFTDKEKSLIPRITVSTEKNSKYNTNPGNNTQDQVFLLSIEETYKYFYSDRERVCIHTEYSAKQGCPPSNDGSWYKKNHCWWWLRSPGNTQNSVATVNGEGIVLEGGYNVNGAGSAVRPALWINLNS